MYVRIGQHKVATAPWTGQSAAPGIKRFFSATTFPRGFLQAPSLRIFFPPPLGCGCVQAGNPLEKNMVASHCHCH